MDLTAVVGWKEGKFGIREAGEGGCWERLSYSATIRGCGEGIGDLACSRRLGDSLLHVP